MSIRDPLRSLHHCSHITSLNSGGNVMDQNSYELTIEQQFQMRLMEESAQNMSREQALDLLVQASQLLMVKDNVIRNLLQRTPIESFGFEG